MRSRLGGGTRGRRGGGELRALRGFLLALLLLFPGLARAWERVVVVQLVELGPGERERVERVLARRGFERAAWWSLDETLERLRLVSVVERAGLDACGGEVPLGLWRQHLERAQEQLGLLDLDGALATLAALELETTCLAGVPERSELFLVEVLVADAHRIAALSAGSAGERVFHQGEVEHALGQAAAVGPDLPAPAWLDPGLAARLAELQADADRHRVPLAFFGTERGVRVDGERAARLLLLPPGRHLVQGAPEGPALASRAVDVGAGERLLVQVDPGGEPLDEEDLRALLEDWAAGEETRPGVLAALLAAVGGGSGDAWLLGRREGELCAWERGPDRPVPVSLELPPEEPAAAASPSPAEPGEGELAPRLRRSTLPWWVGLGPAGAFTNLSGGALEGLGGPAGGLAAALRVRLGEHWALAASLGGVARVSRLPANYDADWLVRLQLPGRLGLRWGPPREDVAGELGLDLGLDYLGPFEGRQEARAFGALAAGLGIPLAPRALLALELWAGGWGSGYRAGGLQAVVGYHPPH